MSLEILQLVDALAREKNVDKEIVLGALEHALALATKNDVYKRQALSLVIRHDAWAS